MVDAVVSQVVKQIAGLLLEQAKEEIDLFTGVEDKVRNLSKTLTRIQAVLADAEQKKIRDELVKLWVEDLEDVSYEINDVLDEWYYMILRHKIEGSSSNNALLSILKQWVSSFNLASCLCFKQVAVSRDIALKIKELSGQLELIDKQKNQFGFASSSGIASNSQEWKRIQSTSFIDVSEVFGRVSEKNNIVSHLLSESRREQNTIQILSLIGTGGIGKTTLAQLVYNDDQVKSHFTKRAWVCVSDPFDEIRVAKAILESLQKSSINLNELDSLLQQIRDSISGKKILLVLDDVWTEDETKWISFKNCLMHGAPGSTILLTTRSERVAIVAGATALIHLGVLLESDSWSLFCKAALSDRTNQTERKRERLESIGRKIVEKCMGLPLAIKTIGSLLRFKHTVEEWEKVMDSNMWELEEAQVKLFPHLYLSYNDLPLPMRRCFSYCAIFPKDEEIEVDDLIRIWMAQGYLGSSGSDDEIELKGREYFENLAMRSFFQDFERDSDEGRIISCKMHDIVHDFAQFLTKRECLIIEGEGKEAFPFCENARHLTFLGGDESTLSDLFYHNMGQTRSFLAANLELETLTAHMVNSLKGLRVLLLHDCGLKEVSREIRNLIHLRYLDLRGNEELREFPTAIYDLYNLQTLNLSGCDELKVFPPGIEKLTKLRHLILDDRASIFPRGIRELTCLQALGFFFAIEEYSKLEDLKNLNQLRGSLEITTIDSVTEEYLDAIRDWGVPVDMDKLGNVDRVADAKNANLKSKKHIQELVFIAMKQEVMEALEPPPNLERLKVKCYEGSRFPTWMTSLNNLRELTLSRSDELTSLPSLRILPSLERLKIKSISQFKLVGAAFLGVRESPSSTPAIGFLKLKRLEFKTCEEWEEWEDISPQEQDDDTLPLLPELHRLDICGCSKLKALPHRLLQKASSLKEIGLSYMEMTSLPPLGLLPSLEKLSIRKFGQLKNVGPEFLGITHQSFPSPAIVFPKLKSLEFTVYEEWEEWEDISPQEQDDDTLPLMPELDLLIMSRCSKLKALPHRLLQKASSLKQIKLFYMEMTSLPPLGLLPSLEKLSIEEFGQLKNVGPEFLGITHQSFPSPAIVFPKLKSLEFTGCEEWEEWEDTSPEEEEEDDNIVPIIFPCLRQLDIWNCPKLKALPHRLLCKASTLEFIRFQSKEGNLSTSLSTTLTPAETKVGQSEEMKARAGTEEKDTDLE